MRGAWLLVLALACTQHHRKPGSCDGPCPASPIDHLVVIVQENHSFDSYFARYCTAPAGSAPSCTSGPSCCEAGPDRDPAGATPTVLDDAANGVHDPDHTQTCELAEMNGGAMDRYASGAGQCSDSRNVAYADPQVVAPYWQLASAGALADRYFQPIVGQSSSNDMYLARAQFVFLDNAFKPDAIGKECSFIPTAMQFVGPTIGDLLDTAHVSWAFYAEGYQAMIDARAQGRCPKAPADCPFGLNLYPCDYDPSDVPFAYYPEHTDVPRVMRDYGKLAGDLAAGTLPQVVFVKGLGYHSEHPGQSTTISDGAKFVGDVVAAIRASDYAPDTLVRVTWDEGGGFFDHVAPPPPGSDGQPYGTRVPLVAIGPLARAGAISHATLEHSSIVAFVEWYWLGMQTGQLGGRDAHVANIGSVVETAAGVPE
jgi:phospholipase C